jgi:hypothetical protein
MKTRRHVFLTAIAAGAGLALATHAVSAQQSPPPLTKEQIAAIVASPDRSAADRTNDRRRKPEEMLLFIGIRPGITALDLSAAGGYTTELLARSIGPSGIVYGQSRPRDPNRPPTPSAAPEGNSHPTASAAARAATPAGAPRPSPMHSPIAALLSGPPASKPRRSPPSSGHSRIPFRPSSCHSIS